MENEYDYNTTPTDHTRRNVMLLVLILIIIAVGGFTIYQIVHKSTNNATSGSISTTAPKGPEAPAAPKPKSSSSASSTSTTGSTNSSTASSSSSNSTTNSTNGLSNTGPGNTVALFIGVAVLGSLGYYFYQHRQVGRSHK